MNIRNFILFLFVSLFATVLRFYFNNIFVTSIIGSFLFGFVIAKKLSTTKNKILLTGFCSCLTSYSGFLFIFYKLISEGDFMKVFIYLNTIFILNLFVMYGGFVTGRKIT